MSRLTGLDALRGIAALCVLLFHLDVYSSSIPYFSRGYLAVDFFFMLSGFVMARTYEGRFGREISSRSFLWNRLRRLWPLIALGLAIGFLRKPDPLLLLTALLLIPSNFTALAYPQNGPAWSILCELAANFCHTLLFRRLSTSSLALISATSWFVCLTVEVSFGSLDHGAQLSSMHLAIPRVLFAYSAGIVLWRVWGDQSPFHASPLNICTLPVAIIAVWLVGFGDVIFLLVCIPIIGIGIKSEAGPTFRMLGAMSFPLYATHSPIIQLLGAHGFSLLAALSVAIALAIILTKFSRVISLTRSAIRIVIGKHFNL